MKVANTYTEKHLALAEFLELDPSLIENENDENFYLINEEDEAREMWVLTREESLERLKIRIEEDMSFPFYSFKFSFVATALGLEEEEIKEFFLPEILLNEITFSDDWIDSQPLKRYVENTLGIDSFLDVYSNFLMDLNRSGECLCNKTKEIVKNGFHIYYRH